MHEILGIRANPQPLDRLVSLAPAIMVGLPLLQCLMIVRLPPVVGALGGLGRCRLASERS